MAYPGVRLGLLMARPWLPQTAPKHAGPLPAKRESGNHDCLLSSKGSPA